MSQEGEGIWRAGKARLKEHSGRYVTEAATKQARQRTSNMRQFLRDMTLGAKTALAYRPFKRGFICGEIPEWSKGADCKSAGNAYEGSNPSLPINTFNETT